MLSESPAAALAAIRRGPALRNSSLFAALAWAHAGVAATMGRLPTRLARVYVTPTAPGSAPNTLV